MKMHRGEIWLAAIPGDLGKVRPQVIVQSNVLNDAETVQSVLVCPLTSEIIPTHYFRLTVPPSPQNGLKLPSQIMADKISAISRTRLKEKIGRLDPNLLHRLGLLCALAVGTYDPD